ncbi:hypothetical protein D9758_001409 [Tetrapyrgos nigripes]|uniref:Beta-galactosidase n=1 Tax=Tetrapyrgos nigripes TaxID=182062 RepID=A0A8H5GSH6_9AGAR|nr:hypothetical protein D9758_001409 [Tetrapyrgos nigripes]
MLLSALLVLFFALSGFAARTPSISGRHVLRQTQTTGLQDIVTWDQYSFMINGKRIGLFGGEIHPYRMPVQSLHLDVFQKVKALGFNVVSFYIFWGILEPKRGEISFEGFRDLQPFFDAAMEAGIYLIARPGPYINAETAGGGLPGWGTNVDGLWRTSNSSYVEAYQNYIKTVGAKLAENQITNGGPIILVQAENEYSGYQAPYTEDFEYETRLIEDLHAAGITVPITHNDAWPGGHYLGVDVYGYDSYPNGFDCTHPTTWLADAVPEYFFGAHEGFNPEDPNAVYEFQGGAIDSWGGPGYANCAILTGPEFERVFYKNEFAMSTTMLNLYMLYGGTNWGGIASPGVYTSYDYGAAIAEDRSLREKYYELKLQANFWAVSPAFLTSRPMNIFASQATFTGNDALKTTQTLDAVGNQTGFYVVRQTDASTDAIQKYKLTVPTSIGELTIPQLGGELTLNGKDSKIHVVDYKAGSTILLYSTGEIFTWATIDGHDIILVYGNEGELHETAFKFDTDVPTAAVVSGSGNVKQQNISGNSLTLQYETSGQTVVEVGSNILLYILDRDTAYDFWVLHPPSTGSFTHFSTENPIIIKGGYLMRSVSISGDTLSIAGDLNTTVPSLEIIAPAASSKVVKFNGKALQTSKTVYGTLKTSEVSATLPEVSLPDLRHWKTADSLPEISSHYSDDLWTVANRAATFPVSGVQVNASLAASLYGYHTGNILWRGHFNATGSETGVKLDVWGGTAFGYSVWLDSTFLGSWEGDAAHATFEGSFNFPTTLKKGAYVLTVLQDHMGIETNWWSADDFFKTPRGIQSFEFLGSNETQVTVWKVTGNLGGENYVDKTRGPLNEGGLFAERQGWHLPGYPDGHWKSGSPTTGISQPGVSFYRTTFDLNVPSGVDYPMALVVSNATDSQFRSQFYVNGYQFGKYINHIGPQTVFPVPQGILKYQGSNTLAVSLWAAGPDGAKFAALELKITSKTDSSMRSVVNAPMPDWTSRPGVY